MKRNAFVSLALGLAALIAGTSIWQSRFLYNVEPEVKNYLKASLDRIDLNATSRSRFDCQKVLDSHKWLLFVLTTNLRGDAYPRSYFETSTLEDVSLRVTYTAPQLTLILGSNSDPTSVKLPIRVIRRSVRETLVIAVSEGQIRVLANGTDETVQRDRAGGLKLDCESIRLGDNAHKLSSGQNCRSCNSQLLIASDGNLSELDMVLDKASNKATSRLRDYLGTILSLLGIVLVGFGTSSTLRSSRDSQDDDAQDPAVHS